MKNYLDDRMSKAFSHLAWVFVIIQASEPCVSTGTKNSR